MKRSTTALCLLALVLTWLGPSGSLRASSEDFKVIVHPDNQVATLSRQFVRDSFLRVARTWSDGTPIRPIDLPVDSPARASFAREVLKKSVAHLKNYWAQRIFAGIGVPPPQAESSAAVIAYVRANPGAIGYLPADAAASGVKVVPLR